jgi:L-ascorbate metabolism protein UlaG (beta-lactamase superfamily)
MALFDPRVLGAFPAGVRRERIEASPRFKDGRFHNTEPLASPMAQQPFGKRMSIIGEFFFGRGKRTPPGLIPVDSPLASWSRAPETGLRATWLGHSTVLVEIDGFRILTDPVWGERVSPFAFAGPKRFHRAPVDIAALPPLDAIIVSHDHYDHLDYPSVLELARTQAGVPFVTSLGVGAHLEAWGIPASRIIELEWWEETLINGARGASLSITAAPSRHFSGRGNGSNRTAWSSFSIRTDHHSVFFSGDTGLTSEFEDIRRRLGAHDLLMLEVGAFHPSWGSIHLGPENALVAQRMLGGGALLPVHWATFDLGLHPWDEPAEVLVREGEKQGARLVMPRVGSAIEPSRIDSIARIDRIDAWWRALKSPKEDRVSLDPHAQGLTTARAPNVAQ